MTEYETDPQRRPADPESVHPTAELPRAESAQSPYAPDTAPAEDRSGPVPPGGASSPPAPESGATSSPPAPGTPAAHPGQPGSAGQPGQPGHPGHPGQPGDGPYLPWYSAQPGWPSGHPGSSPPGPMPPAGPMSPYASPGGPVPPHAAAPGTLPPHAGPSGPIPPGGPLPPWAPQPAPRPSTPPGRVVRFVVAGVALVALMVGSGIGGGLLALTLFKEAGTTINYSAAPVINGADLPGIAASVQDSVVSIQAGNGEGSGVVLSADGFILTNNHVIASAGQGPVRVVFANGTSATAKIVGTDPRTDLAVVKASGVSDLKPAKLGDSDAMRVGDQVLALGSPLGLQGSVTAGILSAKDRTIRAGNQQDPGGLGATSISGLLQTDAPINPGNSGGALVNTRGEVIGINTAIATSGQSTGNIGVGFAIPSNKAKRVAEQLQRGEKVSHPSLGVSVTAADGGGALIAAVNPGSAADKAGLRQGDVVTKFGGRTINESDDLVAAVQAGRVGDRVEIEYRRNGVTATTTATLAEAG